MKIAINLPLHLGTIKSSVGHTEPAAGSLGILRLLYELDGRRQVALLHMTTVNSYVISALDAKSGVAHIPRSNASLAHVKSDERIVETRACVQKWTHERSERRRLFH